MDTPGKTCEETCFQSICVQNIPVLWLTPLFRVDYTRVNARPIIAHWG